MMQEQESSRQTEHLFRRERGKIVARLSIKFGSAYIDAIEDAVQDALLKATQIWGYAQIPDNPSGWLYRVSSNHLVDFFRRTNKNVGLDSVSDHSVIEPGADQNIEEIPDELLRMIFACCHPSIQPHEQVMLCLKLLCGLNVREIARALFKTEETVKKAITRAKKNFKVKVGHPVVVPEGDELRSRIGAVVQVLYLLFSEGHKCTAGERLLRKDICEEAIRLALLLTENHHCNLPEVNALLALMLFNIARFDSRQDTEGNLVTLKAQDRSLWNRQQIEAGLHFLAGATDGARISSYQLEAGIAGLHATAPAYEDTDWEKILLFYDMLLKVNQSPAVLLNRVVAYSQVNGPGPGLTELDKLESAPGLINHYLLYSIKADLLADLDRPNEAEACLRKACDLAANEIEKRFLRKKLIRFGFSE
jgi:RNA polymerase sigma-70 factor (ECF subfamily)